MKNSEKSADGQSGFTLVEVLIATVVLAIGLLSIAQAFAQGMLILVNTPVQLAAKELAFEIIDNYVVLSDAGLPADPIIQRPITNRDGKTFLVSATPTMVSDTGGDVLEVEIFVSYCTGCGVGYPDSPTASNARTYHVKAEIEQPAP